MDLLLGWIPYIILVLILLFFTSKKVSEVESNNVFICFVIIFIFSGIRFNVGYDYATYYSAIAETTSDGSIGYERFEFFNRVLIDISRFFNFPQLYYIITSLITYGLITLTVKRKSLIPEISLWVLIGFPLFYMQSLSIIRQWVAIAILFYGIGYLESGKYLRFLVLIVLAFLWHETAFVAVLLIPISFLNLSRTQNFLIILSTPILYFLLPQIILALNLEILVKAQLYIESEVGQGNANTKIVYIASFFAVLNMIFYKLITNGERTPKLLLTYYNVGAVFFVVFQQFGFIGARGGSYFLVFLILLFPYYINIFNNISKSFFYNSSRILMLLLFFLSLLVSNLAYKSGSSLIDPYSPYQIYIGKQVSDLNI